MLLKHFYLGCCCSGLGQPEWVPEILTLPLYEANPKNIEAGYYDMFYNIQAGRVEEYGYPDTSVPRLSEEQLEQVATIITNTRTCTWQYNQLGEDWVDVATVYTREAIWKYSVIELGNCGENARLSLKFVGIRPDLVDEINRAGIRMMFTMLARGAVRNDNMPDWSWITTLPARYLPYAHELIGQWESVFIPNEIALAQGDSPGESFFQTPFGKLWMVSVGVLAGGALAAAFGAAAGAAGAAGAVPGGAGGAGAGGAGGAAVAEAGIGTLLAKGAIGVGVGEAMKGLLKPSGGSPPPPALVQTSAQEVYAGPAPVQESAPAFNTAGLSIGLALLGLLLKLKG